MTGSTVIAHAFKQVVKELAENVAVPSFSWSLLRAGQLVSVNRPVFLEGPLV
jgi:hypothetical protein